MYPDTNIIILKTIMHAYNDQKVEDVNMFKNLLK